MNSSEFQPDCIVIGSGPAGVSVAWALVERDVKVLMIDGGPEISGAIARANLPEKMLGPDLEALVPEDGLSPKLRTPKARKITEDFRRRTGICGDGFIAVGAVSSGGLSQIWGGLVCEFDRKDIEGWPISIEELQPSYKAVVDRIGVSGSTADEMADFLGRAGTIMPGPSLGATAARLLTRYDPGALGPAFGLGLARNAILTLDRGERLACDLRRDCLWGCDRGAIYDSRFDIAALLRNPRFRLKTNAYATSLTRVPNGWSVQVGTGAVLNASRIILAAGALNTAKLIIPLLPTTCNDTPLLNNPVAAIPLLVPCRSDRRASSTTHSLAQLVYRFNFGEEQTDYVTGAVYEIDGLPSSFFTAKLPLSRRGATVLFHSIAHNLLALTCYFPGRYSDNKLRWKTNGADLLLTIHGGAKPELAEIFKGVRRHFRKIWWRVGGVMLPGASLATPGTDVHYAGSFGMGRNGASGTSRWGELNCAAGIYVADGSAIPTLPSKHLTLTIMANADRIGRHLSRIIHDGAAIS